MTVPMSLAPVVWRVISPESEAGLITQGSYLFHHAEIKGRPGRLGCPHPRDRPTRLVGLFLSAVCAGQDRSYLAPSPGTSD